MSSLVILKHKLSKKNQIIYTSVLIFLILGIIATYYLKTTISIKSQGLLQSATEKADLNIPVNGIIKQINLKDNANIVANDTLLVIDANLPEQENELLTERINKLNQNLGDIQKLLSVSNENSNINLQTNQYTSSWQQYQQEYINANLTKEQAKNVFTRYEKLYKGKVLTTSEYEKYQFDYEQAKNACLLLNKKYHSQWQAEANQYKEELRQLSGKTAEITAQKKLYVLTAPITGSLQNVIGLQPGTYVFANQKIGEISPDTKLTAYCYIKPSDIGLIRKGQDVRFNIDAFNYNQWGFVTGKVIDISDDILIADKQPVFKVKCSLDQEFLKLKNGYKGNLKKGMTFNARFMVTERTLYQLLYDKVDDWVNPNLASN